ncbi:MAG: 23S rRNA (guanosine(2251)-2'-O)-methyltransferase RlmB [Alphaproteobacteria bacterium]
MKPRKSRDGKAKDRSGQVPRPSSGTLWLYGVHPVRAALANPRRRRLRLLATREAVHHLGSGNGPPHPPAEIVDRATIDRLLPHTVHQGLALEALPLEEPSLEEVLAGPGSLLLVLDRANDPHNVGAVLRSAAAFGAAAVILPKDHAPPISGALAKAASGALEVVSLVTVTNLARALDAIKEAGYWSVGLSGEAPQTLDTIDLKGRIALIIGAEGEGLRRLTREGCDFLARLPTAGPIADVNLSNAAAIALYEAVRQRAQPAKTRP